MNENLITAFDQCLPMLEGGSSLDECLNKFPDLAVELRPRLEFAIKATAAMKSARVPREAEEASRARFLAQAASLGVARDGRSSSLSQPLVRPFAGLQTKIRNWLDILNDVLSNRAVAATSTIIVVIFLVAVGLNTSAKSLPGTPLYSVKLTIEQTQINLTTDAESRARLEGTFSERRTIEAQQVTELGWSVPLEFGGLVNTMDGNFWEIDGILVAIPAGTPIEGKPQTGLYVWVSGTTQPGGTVVASKVQVEGTRIEGRVDNVLPGKLQVDGQWVLISEGTKIYSTLRVGDRVEISAVVRSGGNKLAEQVSLVESSPSNGNSKQSTATTLPTYTQVVPTNTPTRLPTKTATQAPTEDQSDVIIIATPSATDTPIPTQVPTSTPTQEPTSTPAPTETSTPTETATSTPTSTLEPSPTPTIEATATMTPTITATVSVTPTITATVSVTPTITATISGIPTFEATNSGTLSDDKLSPATTPDWMGTQSIQPTFAERMPGFWGIIQSIRSSGWVTDSQSVSNDEKKQDNDHLKISDIVNLYSSRHSHTYRLSGRPSISMITGFIERIMP